MALSREISATSLFGLVFSFSSSLSRLACSTPMPPYSLRQPVIGLFGDSDFSTGFTNSVTLADQDFSLAELVDDLLRFEYFSGQ